MQFGFKENQKIEKNKTKTKKHATTVMKNSQKLKLSNIQSNIFGFQNKV